MSWWDVMPSVYFRQHVAIENKRLWVFYVVSRGIVVVSVGFLLINLMELYSVPRTATLRFQASIYEPPPGQATWGNPGDPFCTSAAAAHQSLQWNASTERCSFSCERHIDAQCERNVAFQNDRSIFISTAVRTELHFMVSPEQCQNRSGAVEQDGECRLRRSTFIPGVEHLGAFVIHGYAIELPTSYWHIVSGIKHLPETDVLTVFYSELLGKEVRRVMGSRFVLTVGEALEIAGVDLDEPLTGGGLFTEEAAAGLTSRIVGVDLDITLDYSNNHEEYSDSGSPLYYPGPVCKLTIRASRNQWVSRAERSIVDLRGSSVTNSFTGVRLNFAQTAKFSWFSITEVLYKLTLSYVWMQIPFFLIFYIATMCLGALSDVYNGFLYDEVDLHSLFNGVSARMLEKSTGFGDLYDIVSPPQVGVSPKRLQNRMTVILEKSEELDVAERNAFAQFFFEHTCADIGIGIIITEAISLEGFLRAAMSCENMQYDDIIHLIDQEAWEKRNVLERFFMDSSLHEFGKTLDNFNRQQKRTIEKSVATTQQNDRRVNLSDAHLNRSLCEVSLAAERRRALGSESTLSFLVFSTKCITYDLEELAIQLSDAKRRLAGDERRSCSQLPPAAVAAAMESRSRNVSVVPGARSTYTPSQAPSQRSIT